MNILDKNGKVIDKVISLTEEGKKIIDGEKKVTQCRKQE